MSRSVMYCVPLEMEQGGSNFDAVWYSSGLKKVVRVLSG